MSEFASATIVLRRHDGSSVEIDIPEGNYVDAKVDGDRGDRIGPADFTGPPRYLRGRSRIEVDIRAEFAPGGPPCLATLTNHPAEERA